MFERDWGPGNPVFDDIEQEQELSKIWSYAFIGPKLPLVPHGGCWHKECAICFPKPPYFKKEGVK